MKRMKMELAGAMILGILLFGGKDALAQSQGTQQPPAQGRRRQHRQRQHR